MATIVKTKEQALKQAKIEAIRKFESTGDYQIQDEVVIENEKAWLINTRISAQCDCGETPAIEVTLFAEELVDDSDEQYSAYVGYCENCGEEIQAMKDLINWKGLSRFLANNETSVSKNRIPKKYEKAVNDLQRHLKAWAKNIKTADESPASDEEAHT
jgi:hypothetical protein